MKIETEIVQFDLPRLQKLSLPPLQKDYLEFWQKTKSIENLVQGYLKQGWIVSFVELHKLIEKLLQNKCILNASFYQYFKKELVAEKTFYSSFLSGKAEPQKKSNPHLGPNHFPFFRNLDPKILQIFIDHSEVIRVPENFLLIREGQTQRDMFAVLEGQLDIYKKKGAKKAKTAELHPGTVFGEGGFLLGRSRSADIVSRTPCRLIRFNYVPEIFDPIIKKDKAFHMQTKFWAIHAFLKSDIFRHASSQTMDQLIQSGSVFTAQKNTVLFQQGQAGQEFFICLQGRVDFYQNNQAINSLGQGGMFGEISLFYSAGVRTATALVAEDSIFLRIDRTPFYQILSQDLLLAKDIEHSAIERLKKDQQRKANAA